MHSGHFLKALAVGADAVYRNNAVLAAVHTQVAKVIPEAALHVSAL